MIKQFQDLFARLGLKRPRKRRVFPVEDILFLELVEQAKKEQVTAEELAGEIMSAGLRQWKAGLTLKDCWESLSKREKQVTALTCLGYTNRQIGARLYISEETAKTHVANALRKFNMHGKLEMQMALREWDFSEWK
jgi:DNA-binding CsgD family transcriptional regulator